MNKSSKRLILLELNEINFDVVEKYVDAQPTRFPALKRVLSGFRIRTTAEQAYEELEPWIQWPSVHTGMPYADHGVFRLGDIVHSKAPQIFEQLELAGYKVGAISAMNADNRLRQPAYFIPDPWTQTPPDESWWSRALSAAVSQAVNDNAQSRISAKSALVIVLAMLRFARPRHCGIYLRLIMESRKKPWLKALVLDLLLHDVHWALLRSKRPNFSALFLNAGAHIQHHYFFSSKPLAQQIVHRNPDWYVSPDEDPIGDVLELYDTLVGEYFSSQDFEVILSTGLSQKPYDSVKFYYRLKDHSAFLESLGIGFANVHPRMTRDFLIEFDDERQADKAQAVLAGIRVDGDQLPLFGEIDNRGRSLFVSLTYPNEISDSTLFVSSECKRALRPLVSFVAIKNGMHQTDGFAFFTDGVSRFAPADFSHVAKLNGAIAGYFGL